MWWARNAAAGGGPPCTQPLDGSPRQSPHHEYSAHDLRHTAASLAVSAGANVKTVQKMLGHAGTAMTLDVYADQFDDDQSTTQSFTHLAALEVPVLVFGVHGLSDDV
ncbi:MULTISPECIES: tyrosine-type recombinase/integrase [Mycobacteroides]|uniref:tyrosine-type recombinase/integrase n=1 Tax=Mycobacteroides TaxID=670516 RepID=UPI002696598B